MKISPSMSLSSFKRNSFGLSISSLFSKAGREGAYYGDSYDEILRKNKEALGPETINGGFVTAVGGYDNTTTETSPNSFTSVAGNSVARVAVRTNITDSVAKLYYCSFKVIRTVTSGSIGVYARGILEGDGVGAGVSIGSVVGIASTGYFSFFFTGVSGRPKIDLLFVASQIGQSCDVKDISIKEIADYSKLVLFDDANGTVPVFHPLQTTRGKGLLLDRSKGLVRGPELITDPTFDTGNGWVSASTAPTTAVVSGGLLTITSTGGERGRLRTTISTVSERWYEAICENFQGVELWVGSSEGGLERLNTGTVTGAYTVYKFKAVGTTTYVQLSRASVGVFTASGISVKEVLGNHMSQPTAAARGELSARVNIATNTGFTSGVIGAVPTDYIERGLVTGRIVEDASSPSGKAMRVTSTGGGIGATDDVRQAITGLIAGATYRVRLLIKLGTGGSGALPLRVLFGSNPTSQFPLTSEYVWVEAGSLTAVNTSHSLFFGGSADLIADVAAVDVRLTADAIPSIPPYQAVRSATDYDTAGFPVYWRAQTDDWAKARINPNGATKSLVMWAGQKMNETTSQIVLEMSANTDAALGVIRLTVPANAGGSEASWVSKGNIQSLVEFYGYAQFDSPARVIARGQGSITTDACSLTLNNITLNLGTDQGSGTYTEQDVFFGSRGGTSLFANFREYSPPLIIFMQTADSGLSNAQIKLLQRKYAKAAGVTL